MIRDNGKALYDRIGSQGHMECQDDILAVSGIAKDIRDVLLDYQVGGDKARAVVASLKLGRFDRWASNGRDITRTGR